MNVGTVIRALRTEKSLTLEELAPVASIDPSYLGRIERGEREPTIAMLERIASALGTRVSTLFALAEASSPDTPPDEEGQIDMAIRSQYLTLNSANRLMALELLRTMNRVQEG